MWNGCDCPRCGKNFYPTALHAYKDEKGVNYCSWSCLNHRFDEDNEHRVIEMLNYDGLVLNTFNSVAEALLYNGGTPKGLIKALRDGTSYRRFKWRYKN